MDNFAGRCKILRKDFIKKDGDVKRRQGQGRDETQECQTSPQGKQAFGCEGRKDRLSGKFTTSGVHFHEIKKHEPLQSCRRYMAVPWFMLHCACTKGRHTFSCRQQTNMDMERVIQTRPKNKNVHIYECHTTHKNNTCQDQTPCP